ncbi:MAG: protein phosphatase 2C domain-containing protein [Cyanobacteria bacterium J06632_22]
MITCPNSSCQALNPVDQTVCLVCQHHLPHRYLWVVGADLQPGQQLAGRYVAQRATPNIVLDTQPGVANDAPAELPDFVRPYLFLTRHPVNLPRPYALLSDGTLLLEEAALFEAAPGLPELMPSLVDRWGQATPLRQLGWLWQIAQLWQPCSDEQVAGTLLQLPLCRVDGSMIKLLEVPLDPPGQPAMLATLGDVWQPLATSAHGSVQAFLTALCHQLRSGQIQTGDQLVEAIEPGLAIALPQQTMTCDLAVMTDKGPTRQRNEDACYPVSGTVQHAQSAPKAPTSAQLLMVCDGIGGHEGGDVASKLALAVIEQKLKPLLANPETYPDAVTVSLTLEQAICAANDEIAQQNDQESRQARDRMGTTVVLGLVLGPQLYLAHVGDSRAYRITTHRCQQVTLDDDVAAREVRLGYGFYRAMADQPGTGALVQALGMTHSSSLYPNVQRFVLDEDSVFLLCSDGLSDSDRVEQFWMSDLLPLLSGQTHAKAAARSLVQIANTHNGHDNVTVGLLRVQVGGYQPPSTIPVTVLPDRGYTGRSQTTKRPKTGLPQPPRTRQTRLAVPENPDVPAPRRSIWPVLLGLIALVGIAGGVVTVVFSGAGLRSAQPDPLPPVPADLPNAAPADVTTAPPPSLEPLTYATVAQSLRLQPSPDQAESVTTLLPGTLIQVLGKQDTADETRWVQIRVCGQARGGGADAGSTPGISPEQVLPLGGGWILESQLAAGVDLPEAVPDRCVN